MDHLDSPAAELSAEWLDQLTRIDVAVVVVGARAGPILVSRCSVFGAAGRRAGDEQQAVVGDEINHALDRLRGVAVMLKTLGRDDNVEWPACEFVNAADTIYVRSLYDVYSKVRAAIEQVAIVPVDVERAAIENALIIEQMRPAITHPQTEVTLL